MKKWLIPELRQGKYKNKSGTFYCARKEVLKNLMEACLKDIQ